MIDKRIGERIKQCREKLGLTQDQFAERLGLTTNYISTVERGASFPRCEKLIAIINGLETSADAIFCDVITHTSEYRSGILSEELKELPAEEQQRILEIVELMIKQAKKKMDSAVHKNEKDCALNRTVFLFSTNFSTFRLSLMILCISDIV